VKARVAAERPRAAAQKKRTPLTLPVGASGVRVAFLQRRGVRVAFLQRRGVRVAFLQRRGVRGAFLQRRGVRVGKLLQRRVGRRVRPAP
jgi:hypothetical protein